MDKPISLNVQDSGIKQSEDKLLALLKATSDVIYQMSPDWKAMTVLYRRGFLADTQEPNPDWLGKYIHPKDQPLVLGVMNDCIKDKKIFELEHRVIKTDGSEGWTLSRAIPLFDEKGDLREWFGAASDTTGRKLNEEALRHHAEELLSKEREYLEIIDSSSEGSFIHDLVRGEIYFSSEWKSRLGLTHLSPAQAAETFLSLAHPADVDGMQRAYEAACKHRSPKVKMVFRAKTNEGYIWILGQGKIEYDDEGKPIKYYGTHMDITEQKNAEERLAFQAHLLDEINDAVIATDMDFLITHWNAAAERTYGWTAEEALGQNADALFQTEYACVRREELVHKLMAGETVEVEVTHTCKDGSRISVHTKVSLLCGKNDMPIGTVGVLRDITGRKRAEDALRFQANILQIMDDAIVAFDPYQHITYWSPGACKMYGWTEAEALGRIPAEILNPLQYKTETFLDKEKRQAAFKRGELVQGENVQRRKGRF